MTPKSPGSQDNPEEVSPERSELDELWLGGRPRDYEGQIRSTLDEVRRLERIAALWDASKGVIGLFGGLLLLLAGLAFPWLAVPLDKQQHAFSLGIALPGLPVFGSYGVVVLTAFVIAVLGLHGAKWAPNSITAFGAVIALTASICFVVASLGGNGALIGHLESRIADYKAITSQFHYAIKNTPIVSIGPHPLAGTAADMANALRLGWWCTVAGSIALLVMCGRSLGALRRFGTLDHRWKNTIKVSAVVFALLCLELARGPIASHTESYAVALEHQGNYKAAKSDFNIAFLIDSRLEEDHTIALAYGEALRNVGQASAPLAQASQSELDQIVYPAFALAELKDAHAHDPNSEVITSALRSLLIQQAKQSTNPALLNGAVGDPTLDDVSLRYTLGRLDYDQGDLDGAIAAMTKVDNMSPDYNVRSSAQTYIALSLYGQGHTDQARAWLLKAVATDRDYFNSQARSLAAGLYQTVQP